MNVGESQNTHSLKVRDLGVTFDQFLNFDDHITAICRSTYFHIRNIGKIRNLLSYNACSTIIHALISCRLDYCNSLLYNVPTHKTDRLQRLQNQCARILTKSPRRREHITPVLKSLHWLKIQDRITYKILMLTYKSYYNIAPTYLCELISRRESSVNTRLGSDQQLSECLTDKYAPLQCKKIALRPHSPWYTSALRREKRARRRGERVAARTQLEVDQQIVQNMYRRRNEQLVEAKSTYFTNKVKESMDDPKALFRLTRNMMGNSGDKILPVHTCKRKLANDFSAFFTNKILNIRSELGLTDTHTGVSVTNCFSGVPLNTFRDATEAEIWNIIKLSTVKSCELDPLPTWLLKECNAELIPLITDIVNMSLRESMIPKSLKTAHIRPLLKKTGLDSDILKNYRPVSNLTFISKVIEKVISGRLNEHLINNSLFDPLQSAYRDKHSTETALIKV